MGTFWVKLCSWEPTKLPWGSQKCRCALGNYLAEIREAGELVRVTVAGGGDQVTYPLCSM